MTPGSVVVASPPRRPRSVYIPAVGPRLKILLMLIFASVAFLGATGVYLSAITFLNWWKQPTTYTNAFTLWMFLLHSVGGVAAMVPFFVFGLVHLWTARRRPNREAVRRGIWLFVVGSIVCLSGLVLIQLEGFPQLQTGSWERNTAYILHIALPLVAVVLYVAHRHAGPDIQWKWGIAWGVGVAGFVGAMVLLHAQDPRKWNAIGPKEGVEYFFPSEARTADGNFIPAHTLMMDEYCMKCHQDIYNDHLHSAHKFSSFNNPPYLFSVRETREVSLKRDGNVKAARWCAGCHDPVPFFSGAFDDPNFDDVHHPTAQAGITCTVCHAITHVNAPIGNAAYTIENPQHYPFAQSENSVLQWLNKQLVKAKPDFHKKTFLKPFHKTAEFCSTCHKVHLPVALNHYKEFLRGQNHYDSFLLSGVSGHGAQSFYYPPQAKMNCAECHMPLIPNNDLAAKDFDGSGIRKIHDHTFPAANTGLPFLLKHDPRFAHLQPGLDRWQQKNADFLRGTQPDGSDKKVRVDLFGLKPGGDSVHGTLLGPIRPQLPMLEPGQSYLVEVVVRTLGVGHHFSQGTVDSNEIWVDFTAKSGDILFARNGALANEAQQSGPVDEWAHFINVHMLDRHGNRINRRNPQDIFTPLYDHQIPPGAAAVVHYKIEVPATITAPVELIAKVRYRKFDYEYMKLVHRGQEPPILPIIDMAEDRVLLPVRGVAEQVPEQQSPIRPAWQRWNDYGIGCLLEGGAGNRRGELAQAEAAFRQLLTLGVKEALPHGYVNLARTYIEEGTPERLRQAAEMLTLAKQCNPPAPWWTLAWFGAVVNLDNAADVKDIDDAIANLTRLIDPKHQPSERKFNFARDYRILNQLGRTYFKRSRLQQQMNNLPGERQDLLQAVQFYERTLQIEPEDLDAHYGLNQAYSRLSASAPSRTGEAAAGLPENETLLSLGDVVADANRPRATRIQAAWDLATALSAYRLKPLTPATPKAPTLKTLLPTLRATFQTSREDEELQSAIAAALSKLHLGLHDIYRPDDLATSVREKYRKKHPAANHAAEAIVIYPTTAAQRDAIRAKLAP